MSSFRSELRKKFGKFLFQSETHFGQISFGSDFISVITHFSRILFRSKLILKFYFGQIPFGQPHFDSFRSIFVLTFISAKFYLGQKLFRSLPAYQDSFPFHGKTNN